MRVVLVVVGLLVATGAGCIDSKGPAEDPAGDMPPSAATVLGNHTIPPSDGNRTQAWLADFAPAYARRLTASPTEEAATAFLVSELTGFGYDVDVMRLAPAGLPLPDELRHLKAIVATLPGTTAADHWVAWGGHYDTTVTTVEGAYDNGSGTAIAIEVARMLANVSTEKTRAVILFNGEEEGTLASTLFVSYLTNQTAITVDVFVGLDMVGIAYPAPGRPLCFFSDARWSSGFIEMAREVALGALGLPDDNASVMFFDHNSRNSDEAQFAAAGIPTMRFAGLETAGDYWGYHELNDTMDTIHAMTGGPDNFAAGLSNSARFIAGMVLAVDASGVPEADA